MRTATTIAIHNGLRSESAFKLGQWRAAVCRWFLTLAAFLPAYGFADCGEITRRLFGVEVGGPRTHLTRVPAGMSLYPEKVEWLAGGIDAVTGKSSELRQLESTAEIYWHENRVVLVMARVEAASDSDIAIARDRVTAIAGKEFLAAPTNEFLRCGDGLRAQVSRSQRGGPQGSVIPLLILVIQHPKLNSDMQKAIPSDAENERQLASAAQAGNVRAQAILGKFYRARGAHAQAAQWLRRAAEAGHTDAQHELGMSLGLEDPESWLWFEKAATQGSERTVIYLRNVMVSRMCEQYGRTYVELLNKMLANPGQQEKLRETAEAALSYAVRYRQRSRCN